MRWQTFTVAPNVLGPIVAESIRVAAGDPLTLDTLPLDAQVFRRRLDSGERFFFSPSAIRVFKPFLSTYGGVECEAPLENGALDDLLRMDLGRSAVWESAGSCPHSQPDRAVRQRGRKRTPRRA